MTHTHVGKIYTLAEAANWLRLHPRSVTRIARREGLCARQGRDYLFSEADLTGIWEAMRVVPAPRRGVTERVPTTLQMEAKVKEFLSRKKPRFVARGWKPPE